jgi:hypothetical protein
MLIAAMLVAAADETLPYEVWLGITVLVDADAPVTHVTPAAVRRQTTVEPAAGAPEPEEEAVNG